MEDAVRRIDRILLAIHQAHPGRVEMRASLLAPALGVEAFDVLAVKRAGNGLRPTTAYSHVQVDGGRLRALVDGEARALGSFPPPAELDKVWMVRRGHPADVIAVTADNIQADLTLMAGSGRPRLPLWARPSRDADVVRLCRGAVLLVHGEPRHDYRNVVVATDFSRASLAAARTAALLAPNARFVFVHAFQQPETAMMRELELPPRVIRSYREQGWEAARRKLDEFVELFLRDVPPGAARSARWPRVRGHPRLRAAPAGRPAGAGTGRLPSRCEAVEHQRDAKADGRGRMRPPGRTGPPGRRR